MTPEQVRAALEAKAAGTLATTAMLYSHRDIYELLVFRSYGTPYEHFLDWARRRGRTGPPSAFSS